ncbi:MAG: S1C family serine protease, partial [Acutalibacteraceae bacterium]
DYEGMGFAIPVATVKSVVDNLIAYGYVPNRPKLGIQYASVDNYQVYSMVVAIKNLPAGSLVISGISKDSSLANTKAQVGDLIIAVNGQNMDTSDVLLDLINTGAVGDQLTLTLCRVDNRSYQTETFDVTITLVEDKGDLTEEETTVASSGEYDYGGASSFEDFFDEYFGGFGGFGR